VSGSFSMCRESGRFSSRSGNSESWMRAVGTVRPKAVRRLALQAARKKCLSTSLDGARKLGET
jgi:hypothetical protein